MKDQRYVGIVLAIVAAVIVLRVLGVGLGSLGLLAVVLTCPLMMFFMMRTMGNTGHDSQDRDRPDQDRQDSTR
jgi:hypothetical protein